jgi:hypothetical protein
MALPSSGQISILDIVNEGTSGGCYVAELGGYSLGSLATAFEIAGNPDAMSEFYGLSCPPGCYYVDGDYYFAVRNMSSRTGRNRGRVKTINGSYEVYTKPSATDTNFSNYTQVTRSVNTDPLTIYDVPYTMTRGEWVTSVNVTVDGGCPFFTFPTPSQTGSYGANFYISAVTPFLPLP